MVGISVIVGYFALGGLFAWRDMPRLWAAARHEWNSDDSARESVIMLTILTVLFWPIRMPLLWMWLLVSKAVNHGDPARVEEELAEAQRRNAELQRRIAELERQEGIGQ